MKSSVKLSVTTDLNNITDLGFYKLEYINQMGNAPSTDENAQHGYMMIGSWGATRAVQTIFVGYVEHKIYQRSYTGSGWTSWVLLSQHSYMQPYTTLSSLASALSLPIGVQQFFNKATLTEMDCNGYGLWTLIEGSDTGATVLFTIRYQSGSDGIRVISDPFEVLTLQNITFQKDSTGTSFKVLNPNRKWITITRVGYYG